MCPNCSLLSCPERFYSPEVYKKIIRNLLIAVDSGCLIIIKQTSPLSEIRNHIEFPTEIIEHFFCCPVCGQVFVLTVHITSNGGYGVFRKLE